jgi:hypothetical protein
MSEKIKIVNVEREAEDGLIVTFSDGTTDAYVVEELLDLRPHRELVRKPEKIIGSKLPPFCRVH